MGLLIGGSCLTVFEVLDTIWCCILLKCAAKRKVKNKTAAQAQYNKTLGDSTVELTANTVDSMGRQAWI